MPTTTWDALDDDILPEIPGVVPEFVRHHVKLTAIDFCKRSWVWLYTQSPPIATVAGRNSYNLGRADDSIYVRMNGAGDHLRTPDSAENSITGNLTLTFVGIAEDWFKAVIELIHKDDIKAQRSYGMEMVNGKVLFYTSNTNGVDLGHVFSSVPINPPAGGDKLFGIQAAYVASTGLVTFRTSLDFNPTLVQAGTWTQLGAVMSAPPGNIFDGSAALTIGSVDAALRPAGEELISFIGKFYYADVSLYPGALCNPHDAAGPVASWKRAFGVESGLAADEIWSLVGPSIYIQPSIYTEVARVLQVWLDKRPLLPKTRSELSALYGDYMRVEGSPAYFVSDVPGHLILVPTPTAISEATAEVVLAPTRDALGVDAEIFARNFDAIAAGAKARLFGIPKKPWSNPDKALECRAIFEDAITEAKTNMTRSYAGARLRTRAQFF